MLDKQVVALTRKTAGPQLRDLDQPLALGVSGIKAKLHSYGHMYQVLMDFYKQEVGRRAQVIWCNLHRAHNSTGATCTDFLRADLVEAFRVDFDTAVLDLRPQFDMDMQGAPKSSEGTDWTSQLGDARDHELARYEAEIDHYVPSQRNGQLG